MKTSAALIGCAGWSISNAATSFPGEGSALERYARRFDAVEINSSFYRPHRPQTYARWAASVPPQFRFSVKLPREITHDQRLVNISAPLARFSDEAGTLGSKLGCVLAQLPPSLQFDATLAHDFLVRLRTSFDCMIACEARHASWFSAEAGAVLAEHGITRVMADPLAGTTGPVLPTTADSYYRLHGSPRIYYSSYSPEFLARMRAELARLRSAGHTAWCIFDNTASGAAVLNALDLLELRTA